MKSRNNKKLYVYFFLSIISVATVYFIFIEPIITDRSVRVMTWNIHQAVGMDNETNFNRIISEIEEINPDIVGLQEVISSLSLDKVVEALDMEYYYAEAGDTREGNAILSKYPIKEVEYYDLPLIDGSRPRVLIEAKILIHNQEWVVYITHFSRFDKPKDHLSQVKFVLSKMEKHFFRPILFLGDFNFKESSEAYSDLTNANEISLRDTYPHINDDSGNTFNSISPDIRIDYILSSHDLTPIKSYVHHSLSSDHCAIVTEFEAKKLLF